MAGKRSDHEKEKGCWFTAVSHDEECRAKLKKNCEDYKFWAWIDHSPDKETEESDKHFHTHLIIRSQGTRSIYDVAKQLDCPANFIQTIRNKRSLMRYLRHLDNPDKIQYKSEDVHTNSLSTLNIAWTDNQDDDVRRLFDDLDKLSRGQITRTDFVDLHYLEIQKMPFYQKIRIYSIITDFAYPLGRAHRTT